MAALLVATRRIRRVPQPLSKTMFRSWSSTAMRSPQAATATRYSPTRWNHVTDLKPRLAQASPGRLSSAIAGAALPPPAPPAPAPPPPGSSPPGPPPPRVHRHRAGHRRGGQGSPWQLHAGPALLGARGSRSRHAALSTTTRHRCTDPPPRTAARPGRRRAGGSGHPAHLLAGDDEPLARSTAATAAARTSAASIGSTSRPRRRRSRRGPHHAPAVPGVDREQQIVAMRVQG